ncbi:recombinase family protein [Coleofasciculus sp. FACHB-SPT9]|uniref:recombinase family protein n=1 Tax=Coleofasciculus sp. FACHB-SPT9 TaxID=2692791 RepID=UPI00403F29B0
MHDALKRARYEKIFGNTVSEVKESRPELDKCFEHLCNRDSPVVWQLDRQGRSLKYLLTLIEDFNTSDIGFVSLTKSIDTATGGGKLVFSINECDRFHLSSRQIIWERTHTGFAAKRARGRNRRRGLARSHAPSGLTTLEFPRESQSGAPD